MARSGRGIHGGKMMVCPICDAEAPVVRKRKPVHVPMAEDVYVEEEICECPSCGSSTRVGGEMQGVVEFRKLVSAVHSIPSLVERIGSTPERIEKALDWKVGDIERAEADYGMAPYVIAGLRMLALDPGLLERMEEA